jgi:hypothetical protein
MRKLVLMLDWGLLFSFSFEVDAAPTRAVGSVAKLGGAPPAPQGLRSALSVPILGPIAQ